MNMKMLFLILKLKLQNATLTSASMRLEINPVSSHTPFLHLLCYIRPSALSGSCQDANTTKEDAPKCADQAEIIAVLWLVRKASLSQKPWGMKFLCLLPHRHFLFKQGSGSSALLSGAGQGYPLTSGTVYSPPPRPLPRSSVTRPLFTFNKPHRCCNWKCTALSASLLTLTLALLLTYVIGEL